MAGSLKRDHTTISEYVQILRDTGLLRFLLQDKQGHALVRDAEKIYLDNSNLLYALNEEVGKVPLVGLFAGAFCHEQFAKCALSCIFFKTGRY